MPKFCKNFTKILISRPDQSRIKVLRTRCKMWSCEHCAKTNRNQWREHLMNYILREPIGWTFITLTCSPTSHKNKTTLENARKAWDTCYQALYRYNGRKTFDYVRVFEKHESGQIHVHAIVRVRMDSNNVKNAKNALLAPKFTRYLKDLGAAKWGAYIAHAVNLETDTGFVVLYVTKYMTKQAQNFITTKHVRRIQTSKSIGSPKFTSQEEWLLIDRLTTYDLATHDIYDVNLKRHLTRADFADGQYPPLVDSEED